MIPILSGYRLIACAARNWAVLRLRGLDALTVLSLPIRQIRLALTYSSTPNEQLRYHEVLVDCSRLPRRSGEFV